MAPVWMRRTAAGALIGAALAGCDKPVPPAGRTTTSASALSTDGPNQVVLSVPGMI
jgi:hypothetical protein